MNINSQRNQALFESLMVTSSEAQTRYGVTVINDNIEVTVTIADKKNSPTPLDLNNIKQLISDYITTTDETDFDRVINNIYYTVGLIYSGRDIEVMIYDTVECLAVMKTFNTSINPSTKGK
jgi:hypothetical protein